MIVVVIVFLHIKLSLKVLLQNRDRGHKKCWSPRKIRKTTKNRNTGWVYCLLYVGCLLAAGCTLLACCRLYVACVLQAVRCLLAAGCTLPACCSGATSILFRVVVVEVGQSRGGDADAIRACPCVWSKPWDRSRLRTKLLKPGARPVIWVHARTRTQPACESTRPGRRRLVYFSSLFSIPFIIFALLFLSPSYTVVTQIRGHIAGSSPPLPLRFVPCIFIARRSQLFVPSSTRVELCFTHARRSQRFMFFVFFLQINSKSHHRIRTHGPTLLSFVLTHPPKKKRTNTLNIDSSIPSINTYHIIRYTCDLRNPADTTGLPKHRPNGKHY